MKDVLMIVAIAVAAVILGLGITVCLVKIV